jgi:hypothetical protein
MHRRCTTQDESSFSIADLLPFRERLSEELKNIGVKGFEGRGKPRPFLFLNPTCAERAQEHRQSLLVSTLEIKKRSLQHPFSL